MSTPTLNMSLMLKFAATFTTSYVGTVPTNTPAAQSSFSTQRRLNVMGHSPAVFRSGWLLESSKPDPIAFSVGVPADPPAPIEDSCRNRRAFSEARGGHGSPHALDESVAPV